MSNRRFTVVNPFKDLSLTPEDRTKLVEIVDAIVHSKFEEYEDYLDHNKRVDPIRWKKIATAGGATTYIERKKSNPTLKLPASLMVGSLPGTLDENMFGLVCPTLESMRIKASYLNDLSAAALLASIVKPTEEDPFRAIVVKWMEIDIKGVCTGIVWNRDYVCVEGSGILRLQNGDRVGYHIFHSVNFPETHELPNRIRGDLSFCCIFRQEGDRTDCRGTGIMDPRGDMVRRLALAGMVHATMAGLKYSYCGQMKKLAWLLEQKYSESREGATSFIKHGCVTCSKLIKSSTFGKQFKSCKICFGPLCRSCKVSKKLSFISADLKLTRIKVIFCVKCVMEATRMDTLEAARYQFVYKTSGRPISYLSSSPNSNKSDEKIF